MISIKIINTNLQNENLIHELTHVDKKNKQRLTLNGNISIPVDLKEYDHLFESITDKLRTNTIMIHSHNINNIPLYATDIKNRSILNELKTANMDTHLW